MLLDYVAKLTSKIIRHRGIINVPSRTLEVNTAIRKIQVDIEINKVYDMLGNEIAKLVNEELPAGEYVVTFDVETRGDASLQSGIYFYRLSAGRFSQTKKLVLLK